MPRRRHAHPPRLTLLPRALLNQARPSSRGSLLSSTGNPACAPSRYAAQTGPSLAHTRLRSSMLCGSHSSISKQRGNPPDSAVHSRLRRTSVTPASRRLFSPPVGAPYFSTGSWTSVQRNARHKNRSGALAPRRRLLSHAYSFPAPRFDLERYS